jgi:hypothetical protein
MIASAYRLPQIIWNNGRLVPLSEGWLAESIEQSALAAGHEEWAMTNEVARAIAHYLENDWISPALSLEVLREMLRRSLEGIGHREIADASFIVPPRVSISLTDLAMIAPYPLEFFPILRTRIHEAVDIPVRGVRLEGLRECTKILDSAHRWRRTCDEIRDDIVLFARACIYQRRPLQIELIIV